MKIKGKGKRSIKYFSVIAVVCVLLLAAALLLPQAGSAPELEIPAGALALTDTGESTELLTDARQWNLSQLEQHQVYLQDGQLYVDWVFPKKAAADQIDRARAFVQTSFVLGYQQILGPYPYRDVIEGYYGGELEWTGVTCRLWQGGKLAFEDVYDKLYLDVPMTGTAAAR